MKIAHSNFKFAPHVSALAVLVLAGHALASTGTDFSGQWIGNSQLDGSATTARTTLTLRAADSNESTMQIDGKRTCFLKQGSYSQNSDNAVSLTFKQFNGGDSCERLAKGAFTVRAGNSSRSIQFEAAYPDTKGGQNIRRGALTRYP